jgi:hypothetical protein
MRLLAVIARAALLSNALALTDIEPRCLLDGCFKSVSDKV